MPKLNPAFWKWFGDSKVVDKNGEPLIVYHGSVNSGFSTFLRLPAVRTRTGPDGFYFTSDPAAAANYRTHLKTRSRGDIYAVYLSVQNPLDITTDIKKFQKKKMTFGEAKREALKKLDSDHDGVIFRGNAYNPDEIIAFYPTQIKSIDNDGTWDADDPDIRSNPEMISYKESLSGDWPLGTIRKLYNGKHQELSLRQPRSIPYTRGNKIFASGVEKWMASLENGVFVPPDVRLYRNEEYLEDGHHRTEAAKRLKIKEIPVWVQVD